MYHCFWEFSSICAHLLGRRHKTENTHLYAYSFFCFYPSDAALSQSGGIGATYTAQKLGPKTIDQLGSSANVHLCTLGVCDLRVSLEFHPRSQWACPWHSLLLSGSRSHATSCSFRAAQRPTQCCHELCGFMSS